MKVVFDRDKLLAALGPAAAIAPGKKTIASVEGILFECPGDEPGTCRLTAYDMEKGLRTFVEAKSMTDGSFIINSQNILQIVRSMPSGDITIDIDDKNRAKITGGSSFFEIGSIPGENYPSLPLLSGDRNYTIPQYIFRSLVSKTAFAIDQNAQKPIFNGVYFSVEDGNLKCVGCDGNRLGFAEYAIGKDCAETSFIVPGKILFELMKMIHDTEDDITISVARKHCIFRIGDYTYFSRLIDGEYLNNKRIIPDNFEKTAYINTDMMMGAVERASLVTEDKLGGSSSKTYIKLDFEDNVLKISSASTGGSVYEELPIAMTGEALVIGFKCKYLLDALKASDGCETVKFNMNGALMGICIESGDSAETEEKKPVKYKLFVMPIRMNGR